PSGPYSLGSQQVSVTVSDGRLTAQCSSQLDVHDCEAPQLTCPDPIVVEQQRHGQAFVTPGQATASDNCGATMVVGPKPGLYSLGTTVVHYTATDQTGNQSTCSSTIQVVDNRPPRPTTRALRAPE